LAGALGHDAVGIWALSEHKLRLRAATGYDNGTSEAPVDEADTVLASVLREKRAARGSLSELRTPPAWVPPRSANFLVTPIGALEGCQRALDKDPALLGPQLAKASRDARATLMDVRQYMTALRQSETGGLNLPVTLGRLVDDLRRQTGLHVQMEESGQSRALEA